MILIQKLLLMRFLAGSASGEIQPACAVDHTRFVYGLCNDLQKAVRPVSSTTSPPGGEKSMHTVNSKRTGTLTQYNSPDNKMKPS